jgi:VIT1/CCC1 family predicted Fe2+/Mn2+ transporter
MARLRSTRRRIPSPEEEIRRYQANLDDENDGIALYQMMAAAEPFPERRRIFENLAQVEARHAEIWRRRLRDAGILPVDKRPGWRVRLAGFIARRFGVQAALPIIRSLESGAYATYMAQDATARRMAPDEIGHEVTIGRLERLSDEGNPNPVQESWHRTGGGGVLRATVFGVNDGLVSNAALVMGFAGAQVGPGVVLLAGIAGLLAGAFSMGVGEYISMRAQRELFEHQIEIEERELLSAPAEEEHELTAIYQAKGLPEDVARSLAGRLNADPNVALDILIREELGLDPTQLGSAWGAALGSFLAFAVGAAIPVLPFLFIQSAGPTATMLSAGLSAIALFTVGAVVSLFTGRSFLLSGGRQLLLGAAAAALTYGVGTLIGISTGL